MAYAITITVNVHNYPLTNLVAVLDDGSSHVVVTDWTDNGTYYSASVGTEDNVGFSSSSLNVTVSADNYKTQTAHSGATTYDITLVRNGLTPGTYTVSKISNNGSTFVLKDAEARSAIANITNSVSSLTPADIGAAAATHTHEIYLQKSGGTMSGSLNFDSNTWNFLGNNSAIGDASIGGHVCIKPKSDVYDTNGGISFHSSNGAQLVELNASSNTLTSSGSLGLNNNAVVLTYNSATESIEFTFS